MTRCRRVTCLLPALVWALPKCPLCLALWLTALTGFGISATFVRHLQTAALLASAVALLLLLRRTWPRRIQPAPQQIAHHR